MKGKEIKENQLNQLRIYFRKKRKEKKRNKKNLKGEKVAFAISKHLSTLLYAFKQFVCLIRSQPESQSTSLLFLCIKLICYLIRAIKKQSEQRHTPRLNQVHLHQRRWRWRLNVIANFPIWWKRTTQESCTCCWHHRRSLNSWEVTLIQRSSACVSTRA